MKYILQTQTGIITDQYIIFDTVSEYSSTHHLTPLEASQLKSILKLKDTSWEEAEQLGLLNFKQQSLQSHTRALT